MNECMAMKAWPECMTIVIYVMIVESLKISYLLTCRVGALRSMDIFILIYGWRARTGSVIFLIWFFTLTVRWP